MSVKFRLLKVNAIHVNGISNSPSADPDFPASNIVNKSRFRFWKTAASPPATVDVETDLTEEPPAVQHVGVTRIRAYRSTAGITQCQVFSSTDGVAYTLRATIAIDSALDNDVMAELSPTIVAQFWRYRFTNSGQFSCRPWMTGSTASDLTTFKEGFDQEEALVRTRHRESRSLLGNVSFVELGVGKVKALRRWDVSHIVSTTVGLAALLALQKQSMMMRDYLDKWYEVVLAEPTLDWGYFPGVSTARHDVRVMLEQLP